MKSINKKQTQETVSVLKRKCASGLLRVTFTLALCLGLSFSSVFAQGITVSGTVIDETGELLIGANITVKGSTLGTITDYDGNYEIAIDQVGSVLVFSYIGYLSQEVETGTESVINITLQPDILGLEEIVVTGYSSRKRGELTGSVSTVSSEDIQKTSNSDLAKSLSGKVSGLIVQDRGGYPGSTSGQDNTLLIRGKSTLNNNAPLIIVDGLAVGSFSFLSPSDIASISVLKDGAAAIYGARAANGVIVITTNRGKSGQAKINFSSSYRWDQFTRTPKMMNSEQYATYKNEINERIGLRPPYSEEDIENYKTPDNLEYPNTDWIDIVLRDYSPQSRNVLSISGGTDKVKYFVSGDAINQGGLFESDILDFTQYQGRANLDLQLHKNFKLGIDVSGNKSTRTSPSTKRTEIYKAIYNTQPNVVGIYDNGLVAKARENGNNPLMLSGNESGSENSNASMKQAKVHFDWDLDWITEGLSLTGAAYYKITNEFTKSFRNTWTTYEYAAGTDTYNPIPSFFGENTISVQDWYRNTESYQLNAQLNYNRTFSGGHTVRGFMAYEQSGGDQNWFEAYKKGLISADHPDLFSGSEEGLQANGQAIEWGRVNYFGTLAYGYQSKYLLDFTLRYDGSDRFAEGYRFGLFPGAMLGWVITEESFMDNIKGDWLNNLKLRASWAMMGNDRVNAFQYFSRYTFGGVRVNGSNWNPNFYVFGQTPILYNSFYESVVANPYITWEKADTKNLGLSFVLFNSRLSGDINLFFQKRSDILVQRSASIPSYAALTLPQENLGIVDNYGWEFELAYSGQLNDFNYSFGGNFTNAKNRVEYLDEAVDVPAWRKREGHPIDSYILYPTNGIYPDQEAVDNDPDAIIGTKEGDIDYIDTDGDGTITSNDRIRKHSSAVPEIQYGIYGDLSWKGIGLSFLFQGQAKSEIEIFYSIENRPEFWFTERWTPDNRNSIFPRAFQIGDPFNARDVDYYNRSLIDVYLFNANFIRLKEVELSYSLPKELIKWIELRVFARGSNLFTIDNIGWLDPEMAAYHNFNAGLYPQLRSYSIGLNATF